MTFNLRIGNQVFGKCNVFAFPRACRFYQENQASGLSPHTYKESQQADDKRHADQKAQVILTPGVVYFIHLHPGIEE